MSQSTVEVAGGSLFPTYARYPLAIVKGQGSWLWDSEGNKYLDFMSGIAVTNLGHVPQRVKEALVAQIDQLWHISNLFEIPNQADAAKLITDNSCGDAVFFCNSGAEANEAAIKLARRYQQLVARNGRYEVITFTQSFHGRTLATLTATGQDKVKEGFSPLPEGFTHIALNDFELLKATINDKTAAVMLELVQAEGGIRLVDPTYIKQVAELCKAEGILLIIDEIQTGMGRTGKLFAYEHFGIEPDIFTLAKALGSGFPVGAMVAKEALREGFTAGSHGSTFGGTPIATAAVKATIETIVEENVVAHAEKQGQYLVSQLREKLSGCSIVNEVRGLGLIIGIECKEPVASIIVEAQNEGLLVISAGPNVIRLLPNLLVSTEEINQGVQILTKLLSNR